MVLFSGPYTILVERDGIEGVYSHVANTHTKDDATFIAECYKHRHPNCKVFIQETREHK